ncbi:lactate/malate dehydrogenase [Boletus reticuloceps]|uniref:malate dehydrogenase n=1 Tax=Boletus reticuloceps TaxID=495285 RepID=A0A8I2YSI2_9AGAM|nr:lactate/malate dehydrogenase [Boletus reticuloceps]
MFFGYFVLLASLVHASSWFSAEPEYAKWSDVELRTWLQDHNIKIPSSFDKPHLYGLVDANWHSPLVAYAEAGRQWSLDQFNRAQRAFEHIKDDTFDQWDESKLRIFLLEQGVVSPSGPREQLVLLARNKYRAYTDAAILYSSLASASASSAYAGVTDAAHSASQCASQATHEVARAFDASKDYVYSTWDERQLRNWLEEHGVVEAKSASTKDELTRLANNYYRKVTSAVWESWSDSYIREWLIAHSLLKPTDTLSRSSLLGKMKKYHYNRVDSVWNTWSHSELKTWLVDHGFLKSDAEKNRDELVKMLEEHYLSAADSIWAAWTDSDIREWLSEHGYLENGNSVKSREDLVNLINSKYSDASAKALAYLVWPDARLRVYLRERGIGEDALPTTRPGLLQEARIRWVQTSTWTDNMYTRLKDIVNSSVEAAEEKIARILEVLSGRSRYASDEVDDAREWGWGSHKADHAREKAQEAGQRASESLGLFDIVNAPGVAADLSHIATPAKVEGYLNPDDGLQKVLTGADIVVIPAGIPRKPGTNAGIVRDLATGIATTAPKALVLVISNPVNSTVPIVAEVFKKHGVFDPKRIFGVTTLDVVRASTFTSEILGDRSLATSITVPVVGGHSGVTIVPLLSQSSHPLPPGFGGSDLEALVKRIQFGGDEVVKAKGTGSATLSMAYAGAEFANKVILALKGKKGIVAPTFVNLAADKAGGEALKKEIGTDIEYFSAPVELGPGGVEKIGGIGKITGAEKALIAAALPDLKVNIEKGVSFIEAPKL